MRMATLFAIFAIILTACGSEIPPGYFSETDTVSSIDTAIVEDTTTSTDTMVVEEDTFVAQDTSTTDTGLEDTTAMDTSTQEDSYSYEDTQVTDTYTGPVGPCPQEFQPGDLLHVSVTIGDGYIYMLDQNLERMMFGQLEVFQSWYENFLGVKSVLPECLALYPLRSEGPVLVGYRPGSRIIKDAVAPYLYVILPGSSIAQVESQQLLETLYGEDWGERLVYADDIALANYIIADPLTEPLPHEGMLVRDKDQPEDDRVWYVKNGQLVEILGGADFWNGDVVATPETTLNQMPVSQETMTMEDVIDELLEQL